MHSASECRPVPEFACCRWHEYAMRGEEQRTAGIDGPAEGDLARRARGRLIEQARILKPRIEKVPRILRCRDRHRRCARSFIKQGVG